MEDYKEVHSQWMNHQQLQRKRKLDEQLGLTEKQIRVIMAGRDAAIQERDLAIAEKNAAVAERVIAIQERSLAIDEKNAAVAEREIAVEERSLAIAERNQAILQKDAVIAERNIAKLEKGDALGSLYDYKFYFIQNCFPEIETEWLETDVVVSRTVRDEPPTHYQLKIKSFSLLSKSSLERYHSGHFKAGGYKWKLCLYPKGNKDVNGEGHISLYLEISQTDSLATGWEVHALLRLFVLDHRRDRYLIAQDANGEARRFRASKTQSGFDRLITLKEFKDPSNGYLVKDTCVFGAEVFVQRESTLAGKGECLLMKAGPVSCNHTRKINKFSALLEESHCSEMFTAGGCKWRINLWPNGNGEEEGKSLSLFLELNDSTNLLPGRGVSAEAQLPVVDQVEGKHVERKLYDWFTDSTRNWGWRDFLSLNSFRDPSKGYLVKDVCIIEAHLQLIGAIAKWGQK